MKEKIELLNKLIQDGTIDPDDFYVIYMYAFTKITLQGDACVKEKYENLVKLSHYTDRFLAGENDDIRIIIDKTEQP
jgi:hypothetical protein